MFIYYVYSYLREDGTSYYIGKGKGKRAWKKNKSERFQPPKDKKRIIIIAHALNEFEAFLLESKLIRLYGRKELDTGILRNLTDGGDGASGAIRSEEYRQLHSSIKKGKPLSVQHKESLKKAKERMNEETKQKMIDSGKRSYEKTFALLSEEQRRENYKNSLGKLTTAERREIGKKSENKGGEKWSKASANQVTVTDINGISQRISKDLFWTMKNDMIAHNIPIEQWQYVQVSSNESKKRKLKDGN